LFESWQELFETQDKKPTIDCLVIATPDQERRDLVVASTELGKPMLVEKPMALTTEDCFAIGNAVEEQGVKFVLAYVMRYTPFYRQIRQCIEAGSIGRVEKINATEFVERGHYRHSYIRNVMWNQGPILDLKSGHDINMILSIYGKKRCIQVDSLTSPLYYTPENQPPEANGADRCITCPAETTCEDSAVNYYLQRHVERGHTTWPLTHLVADGPITCESVRDALEHGPFGRCAFQCDSRVVGHQEVRLQFENGDLATFSLNTGGHRINRTILITGSEGILTGSMEDSLITIHRYDRDEAATIAVDPGFIIAPHRHAGGDEGIMQGFLTAMRTNDWSDMPTDHTDALRTHQVIYQAEASRKKGGVPMPIG
jgi:predicted dehydrogenase